MFVRFAPVVLVLFSVSSYGQVYRWVDAQGKTHFSDRKPEQHIPTESVEVDLQNSYNGADVYREQQKLFKVYDGDRTAKKEATVQAHEDKKNLARQCEIAQHRLTQSRNASSVFFVDDGGERIYYNDEQRKLYTKRWQNFINKQC